jgi:hypothetical protein
MDNNAHVSQRVGHRLERLLRLLFAEARRHCALGLAELCSARSHEQPQQLSPELVAPRLVVVVVVV